MDRLGAEHTAQTIHHRLTTTVPRQGPDYTGERTERVRTSFIGGPTRWRPVEFDSDSRAMALGLVRGWMESPGHRANILDGESRKIGVGMAITEAPENGWTHETVFATQNFSGCR